MNFHNETIEWLQQIRNVVNDTDNINDIKFSILEENIRIETYNKQLFNIKNNMNKNHKNAKEFRNLKHKETELRIAYIKRKYPEKLTISFMDSFKRIYY